MDEGHRTWAQVVCQLAQDDPVSQGLAQVLSQSDVQTGLNCLGEEGKAAFG